MFERIVCPVDFSTTSERALDYALALGKQYGGPVSVIHVLPKVLADPEIYPYLVQPIPTSDETRDRALQQLGRFVHRALEQGIACDVILEEGDVVEEVVKNSEKLGGDLVVVGTHGRRGFRRLLLGSVTERLLRESPVPVLAIPPSAPVPPKGELTFRNVLCPVDFSESSRAGLSLALALASGGAEVTALHVVEFYVDPALGEAIAFDLSEIRERHRLQAESKLQELIPAEAGGRTRLSIAVLDSGGAYREILRHAEREQNDLIVMGVQGRSALDMMFFGSTANHVVRSASCPVLAVRSQG